MIQLAALLILGPAQSALMFPFVIPWDDAVKGTATDVSFLNTVPAGKNGRILAKGGRLVEEKTGRRVRFLGTNMTARSAFPTKEDADRISARLAKLGVNIVRFHHLQNDWDVNGGTIWKEDRMHREVDPAQLDKLDYLVAALKKQGIYSNVNLQTTRKYFPDMGFPESVLQIPTDFAKKIDKVDRRMIELQKEYAKQLLDRVNPYIGMKYTDDPAIAVVEINNENSLVGWPGEPPGNGLAAMPEPFRGEIVDAWNKWLKERYPTKDSLTQGWLTGITPSGPSIVGAQNKWTYENQSNGDVQMESIDTGGTPTMKITINSNPGAEWHVQSHLTGLDLKNGDSYTLHFRARSSQENTVRVSATIDQSDWHNIGLNPSFKVGPDWKEYTFVFGVNSAEPNHNRIAFVLGAARGTIEVADLTLSPGVATDDLGKGYEESKIDLPEGGTAKQMADYAEFLADTETAYATEMRDYLRNDLGVKANLMDTQISWGGLTSLKRERASDVADNHAYFQHPAFAKSWDPVEWTIPNTPMVAEMVDGKYGELGGLAMYRVEGKPYTVSEYNHPAPNDYRAEMMPLIMTFAAMQDWDIIYTFDYGLTGEGKDNDKIQGFFPVSTDPAKMAFFPCAAMIFRGFEVPIIPRKAVLEVSALKPWEPDFTAWAAWGRASLPNLFTTRTSVRTGTPSTPNTTWIGAEDRDSLQAAMVTKRSKPAYVFDAPTAKGVVGFVGDDSYTTPITFKGLTLSFARFGNGFASVTATAMDRKRMDVSSRVLLTLVGKVENQGMVWKDASRTSVGDKWGNGPTVAEGIPCKVSMLADGARQVFVLDGNGKRVKEVASEYANGHVVFSVDDSYQTLWYEIAK